MKPKNSLQQLLLLFMAFIGILLAIRISYSGNFDYLFLAWNIFLAWIPFAFSTLLRVTATHFKWKQLLLFCSWFLFFPNALYMVTDLIHLELETNIPKWFDALLLFTSSVLGLIMAFISLFRVEKFLRNFYQQKNVEIIIAVILFFGSFGVYLGRFLRWNSWDIIRNPLGLLSAVTERFIFPFSHVRTWGITILFTVLFYLMYMGIKKIPGNLHRDSLASGRL